MNGRPDPDALLADIVDEGCGRLKVFLGAAPGVGKTYAMLAAAREAKQQGTDIVVGIAETHGRKDTEALCEGLETLPLQSLSHHGRTFTEFDPDAVLARRPAVVVVDELAHRNIPGSRHARRYQDVLDLLDAGIDVWTAVNIQHLESLADVVAGITGVRMRETVPDAVLERSRDVVMVDITPRELIERLKQGKVYLPEQARAALEDYFNPGNLAALRELALQTVATRIDADVLAARRSRGSDEPWDVRTRVLVAVDGIGDGERLVRHTRRLAQRRQASWTVVTVDTGRPDRTRQVAIDRAFALAERLGGKTLTLRGTDVAGELLAYAQRENITTLVLGRSHDRPLAGLLGRTLSQRLLLHGDRFEITFIGKRPAVPRRPWLRWWTPRSPARHYGFAAAVVIGAVVASLILERILPLPNLSLVFLTGVLWVAVRTGPRPALVTAVASFLAYNFFLIEPRHTLAIHRPDELLTVLFFLVMALIGGQMASRLRLQLSALRATNAQTEGLLAFSRHLAAAHGRDDIARSAVNELHERWQRPVCVIEAGEADEPRVLALRPDEAGLTVQDSAAAGWALTHNQIVGHGTDTLAGIDWQFLPLVVDDTPLGVWGIKLGPSGAVPERAQLTLLQAYAQQLALALARADMSHNLEQARVAEETERLRSALLSSVSHDLRTPLASMIGSASSLRELAEDMPPSAREELLDAILSEGQRLNRYIQNLLDMTRLGHGQMKIARDWIALEDIVASALRRCGELLRTLRIVRELPAGLPLLYVHPALIEQALVNVIENAARFSPPGGQLRISASAQDAIMRISVIDQGPGIPTEQRQRVFDMFFTGEGGDHRREGSGLGLAICHGMVGAHGGRIRAEAGPGGMGTCIVIELPLFERDESDDEEHVEP